MRKILPAAFFSSAVLGALSFAIEAPRADAELGPYMTQLQVFSQKLGYSIQAQNAELARFYLHEVDEVLDEVRKKIPVHDDVAIARMIEATAARQVEKLEKVMQEGGATWKQRRLAYVELIQSCNTCHQATAHGFIHILPAKGKPPFNQSFVPQSASTPK